MSNPADPPEAGSPITDVSDAVLGHDDGEMRHAWMAVYDEMLHWSEQGWTVLLMERDGENLKLRPIV